ncbi:MAG: Asp-tRNA(Asn)/Glu-tRNA(Gln) amidotransferase subunit GatA [bacterium]|nr:Asp-tRNA(Asn)/Glu-tRNA(Gln) amidotransferase subunit GatA [Gammaproteobacteria bacterium]HIL97795.1 Asp-tRNA(Asn)/Glu-tRNA(Gln) amidotransferase subunit GatA [Pseudomonadales bacterium]
MHEQTITEILNALNEKQYSCVELVNHYLRRLHDCNGEINAFITTAADQALSRANKLDKARLQGNVAPLAGIPIAHKDIFCTEGIKTSAGSHMLDNFTAPYNATVVEKLNDAGAIILGKTNMDEFAMGSSNENSYYGPVKNPWDKDSVPGGSSGGSAAAVAARLCVAATGTDTGGSIRQPASMCGITGLKPTYGRISRWGMIAYASSLDQAGPLAKSAEDVALLLNAMAGFDPRDSTSLEEPVPDYTASLNDSIEGLRIGICREYFEAGLNPAIESAIQVACKFFESRGAVLSDISLPSSKHAIPAYYVIAPAEASANLSRYDGVRFGYRCDTPRDIEDLYKRSRSEGLGKEVKQRIMVGCFALSAGYYEAYYRKAQQIRRLIKNDFMEAFKQVDLIIGPTTPSTAFKIGEKSADQISMYLQDIYTITSNLAGLPAGSFPVGFTQGLPFGMQIIGNYLDEARILNLAHQFQLETNWHKQIPAEKSQ